MTKQSELLGRLGERVAERWLVERGWTVLDRRYRSGHRDLDLVVTRGQQVVFVEVKSRRGREFGHPVEAVDWRKQRELIRSAQAWVSRHGREEHAFRFDVVGVVLEGGVARIRHVENAFALPWRA